MEDKLVITSFTDPVCTWYWGSEPVLRGYRAYETFSMLAGRLSGGALEPAVIEVAQGAVMELAMRRPRLAAEEVRQAFEPSSQDEAWSLVAPLVESSALAGMRAFHHKTRKPLFRIGVPVLLAIHLAICLAIAIA